MAITALPGLSKINTAHSIDATTPSYPSALGDAPLMWYTYVNSIFKSTDYMANGVTNGQFAVAHSTNGFSWVTMSGDATTDNVGVITINAGVVTTSKLSDHARTHFVHSLVELNLSGGAASNIPIFKPDISCTLISAYLEFTVAAGSVAAAVSIGKPGNTTYYLNAAATATGGAIWDKQALTLANTDIAADQSVFCSTDGAGDAGKVLIYLTYKVD